MTTFPGSPQLLKAGIVLLKPDSREPDWMITLQYNPATLTRKLTAQGAGSGEEAAVDQSEVLRVTGPPVETISLEAEIDAADQMERDDSIVRKLGIGPQLAALEAMLYPTVESVLENRNLRASGTMEVIPTDIPLPVFIWGKQRILPVRVTGFTATEEAFDPNLNPIQAKVSLEMRVLTFEDVGFGSVGGRLSFNRLISTHLLAAMNRGGTLDNMGVETI